MVVVHVMVWCGEVCRVGSVVMQLVRVAVVLGHPGAGVGRNGGVVVVLLVSCPLGLREWWSWHGLDVCGWWLLAGLLDPRAVVRWW